MQELDRDTEKTINLSNEMYDEAKRWREKEFKGRAERNWRYFVGDQWHGKNVPRWKAKLVINHCARIVRTHLPYLTDARAQMAVHGRGPEDTERAALIDRLFRFKWDELHMDMRQALAWFYVLIFGIAWYKPRVDPMLRNGMGDVDVAIPDPWHVMVDPAATWCVSPMEAPKNAQYVIQEIPKPLMMAKAQLKRIADDEAAARACGYVRGSYEALESLSAGETMLPPWSSQALVTASGVAVETIPVSNDSTTSETGSSQMYVSMGPGTSYSDRKLVTITERWMRLPEYPNGYVMTFVENILIMKRPNPLRHQQFPFIPLVCNILPGRLVGYGVIDDLIPIQDEINKRRSQTVDLMNIYQGAPILAEKGALDVEKVLIAPGVVIEKNPGRTAEFWQPPPVPPDVWRAADKAEMDIDLISNIKEVLRGGDIKAGTPGVAMEQLAEAALAPIRMMERLNTPTHVELARQMWGIMQQLYERTGYVFRVVGSEGQPVPEIVNPEDIMGLYDFEFIPNSAYSLRRQVWFKTLMDLRAQGAPIPWDVIVETTDLPNKEKIKAVIQTEEARMQREAAMQAQMQPAPGPQGPPPAGG